MNEIFHWIESNKEWIFDGIGVAIITGIVALITYFFKKTKRENANIRQTQKSGDDSINIQAGRDITIGNKSDKTNDK